MILNKLEIRNMFVYQGTHKLDFEIKSNKNVVLVMAENGKGKTNLLRVIKILMHGIKDNPDIWEKQTEKNFVLGNDQWDGIFNKQALINGEKVAVVKGELLYENKRLKITREFKYKGEYSKGYNYDEITHIEYDNEKKDTDFIDERIPKNLSQFFFFDGEKIESLIGISGLNVKESLEKLLNIETYKKLIGDKAITNTTSHTNLTSIKKEFESEVKDAPTKEKIKEIDAQIEFHKAKINTLSVDVEKFKQKKAEYDFSIDEYRKKMFSVQISDTDTIKLQKDDLNRKKTEKIELQTRLNNKINRELTVPFLFCYNFGKQYLEKLNSYNVTQEVDTLLKEFRKLLGQITEYLFDDSEVPFEYQLDIARQDFYRERIEVARKKFTANKSQTETQIIKYYEPDKEIIANFLQDSKIVRKDLILLKKIQKEIEDLEFNIEYIEEDNSSKKDEWEKINNALNEKQNLLNEIESKIGDISREIINLKNQVTDYSDNKTTLMSQFERAMPIQKRLDLLQKLLNFFVDFTEKLLKTKIFELQKQFNETVRMLLPKANINNIEIDEQFNIKLFDNIGQRGLLSKSSGERQILATSLMYAISKVADVDCFVCIDTPLARIDPGNRKEIIQVYYPSASKQVIILATESEIGDTEYSLLKNHLAKEYIIYSNSDNTSYFTPKNITDES